MSIFEQARLRVARARDHGDAFGKSWNTLLNEDSYVVSHEMQGDGTVVVSFERKVAAPHELPLLLGELFYQLRASLDNATFAYAQYLTAPKPPSNESRLYFPVLRNDEEFKSSAFSANPFPDDLKRWVKAIQPYNTLETIDTPLLGINYMLRDIHDLARIDRHRQMHVVGAFPSEFARDFSLLPPAQLTFLEFNEVDLLKDKSEVLRFGFEGGSYADLHLKGGMTLDISVGEIPGFSGPALSKHLHRLINVTSFIIKTFEQALAGEQLTF